MYAVDLTTGALLSNRYIVHFQVRYLPCLVHQLNIPVKTVKPAMYPSTDSPLCTSPPRSMLMSPNNVNRFTQCVRSEDVTPGKIDQDNDPTYHTTPKLQRKKIMKLGISPQGKRYRGIRSVLVYIGQ